MKFIFHIILLFWCLLCPNSKTWRHSNKVICYFPLPLVCIATFVHTFIEFTYNYQNSVCIKWSVLNKKNKSFLEPSFYYFSSWPAENRRPAAWDNIFLPACETLRCWVCCLFIYSFIQNIKDYIFGQLKELRGEQWAQQSACSSELKLGEAVRRVSVMDLRFGRVPCASFPILGNLAKWKDQVS